jgi:RNA polymerase sigma-B factor
LVLVERRPPQEADLTERDRLIEDHRPLALHLARKYAGRGESLDDLTQVAQLALVKAANRFDPEFDVQFSTYATSTIVGELKRHFRDKAWAVRVPRHLQEVGLRISGVLDQMSQELGRSPTVGEIAATTGLDEDEIVEASEAGPAYTADSLDAPIDEEGLTRFDRLGEEEAGFALVEGWTSVAPAVRSLPDRERTILFLRFYRNMTQQQIAAKLGMSQMHVSRLLARTLQALRAAASG